MNLRLRGQNNRVTHEFLMNWPFTSTEYPDPVNDNKRLKSEELLSN